MGFSLARSSDLVPIKTSWSMDSNRTDSNGMLALSRIEWWVQCPGAEDWIKIVERRNNSDFEMMWRK